MLNKTIAVFGLGLGLCLGLSVLPVSAQDAEPIQAEPHDYAPKFDQEDPPAEKPQLDVTTEERAAPQIDVIYQELSGDLDRDGHIERVALIPFQITDNATYMCLVVFNDQDKVIWRSPRLTDPGNKKTFGLYDWGNCDLQLLCDLDKDGYIDLIGGMPRSDVRPAPYRVWKWDGDKFVYQFQGYLASDKNDNELFQWHTKEWDGRHSIRWLDNLEEENGQIKARITYFKAATPVSIGSGAAYFRVANKRGFRVNKWIKHIVDLKY